MRKSALFLAALALAACNVREESHGEVVDTTIDNSHASIDILRDTVNLPGIVDSDTVVLKKPVGRKPVPMKDSLRRP